MKIEHFGYIELWKPIKGFEGLYEVSSLGNVRALAKSRRRDYPELMMKPEIMRLGYHRVQLSRFGETRKVLIHRLVAEAFMPCGQDGFEINHKNGNKSDNRVENLEWVTKSENVNHSYKVIGRKRPNFFARGVNAYSLDGQPVANFSSVKEAAKYFGVASSGVVNGCKKGYLVKNHRCCYAED
jgi:hypothetical protein